MKKASLQKMTKLFDEVWNKPRESNATILPEWHELLEKNGWTDEEFDGELSKAHFGWTDEEYDAEMRRYDKRTEEEEEKKNAKIGLNSED